MFELRMAWRSLRRTRGLTIVMIVALSLGIGTWYAQHQIFTYLESMLPAAPPHLYQVVRGDAAQQRDLASIVPATLHVRHDAERLIAGVATRKTITFGAPGVLEADGRPAERVRIRYSTRDLFELFAIPLAEGTPWTTSDEIVIDEILARRLFGDASALGRTLRVDGADVRIVGVIAASHRDRFYLYERLIKEHTSIYVSLARATHAEPDFEDRASGGTASVWVELPTEAQRAAFLAQTPGVSLRPAAQWRRFFQSTGTINLWPLLAGMCVVTSIVNLVRMLTAKFADRRHDLGLLRAFGARRRGVVWQLLVEAMLIGAIAGVCGLAAGVAMMPLAISPLENTPIPPAIITAGAALVTLGASIGAALLAAIYPAWRLARGTPASQLAARGT